MLVHGNLITTEAVFFHRQSRTAMSELPASLPHRDRSGHDRLARQKAVQIVGKETPTEGHDLTFIEQMLGNLGRFNSPARGMSDRNMGR